MRLREVIAAAGSPGAAQELTDDVEVLDLAYDSRAVTPGALFFCVPGETHDGHDFAADAVARGAVALVVERRLPDVGVPQAVVPSTRMAMPLIAAHFHGEPSTRLQVFGITGTNGKTTTTFLVRALLEAAGLSCGLLGTVTRVVGGRKLEVVRTTPEAIDLQRDLRAMVAAGDDACALEVSSHALELHRVDAVRWAAAIFTNLTQDHLDFHRTMEQYFLAKRRLFAAGPSAAVVNVDDPYGMRLAQELPNAVTFAVEAPAMYRAHDVETCLRGTRFRLEAPGATLAVRSPLRGRYNVANILGAFAAVRSHVADRDEALVAALEDAGRVPGRLEPVEEGQDFAVLVDYAHTPDSLDNVLRAARDLTRGRVVCVFGCGGDRDRAKRALMGEIAVRRADRVIVTSDNPRSEDPQAIIEDILEGTGRGVEAIVDRRAAIERAVELAGSGDVVIIAGKGHEQGQEFEGGRKVPFDDVTVAREALRGRAGAPVPR